MENVLTKNEYPRENYYFEMMIDVRDVFIGFGKWLCEREISGQGSVEDYVEFLNELNKQKENQREEEYLELLCWISNQIELENEFMIIYGDAWDRFYNSDIKDDVMDMMIVEHNEFYEKFKEIVGVDLMNIEDGFVSMTYIDENRNDIELTININGENKKFIIGV